MSNEPRDGRNPLRKVLSAGILGVLVIVSLSLLLAALAPTLLSTAAGRRVALRVINGRIAGSVAVDSLDLSWAGAQRVRGLSLRDAGGDEVLTVGRMENDRSLWQLLTSGRQALGTTTIEALRAEIVSDGRGRTNLMGALASTEAGRETRAGFVPILPFGSLVLKESMISVEAPGIEAVHFDVAGLSLDLPGAGKPLRLSLDAATRQGDLAGELKADGTVDNIVDREGRLQIGAAQIDLTVEADNLPLEGIDGALGYRGLLSAALGKTMDLAIRTRAAAEGVTLDLQARAPNLDMTLGTVLQGGSLVLREEGRLRFLLTPRLVVASARARDPESSLRLEEAVPFDVRLEALRLPVVGFSPAGVGLQANVAADGEMRLSGIEGLGALTVRTLSATVASSSLGGVISVGLFSDLVADSRAGKASLDGTVAGIFDDEGRLGIDGADINMRGELGRVPTALVEKLTGAPALLRELAGPALDAEFDARTTPGGEAEANLALKGQRVEARASLVLGDTLRLKSPAKVVAAVTPAFVRSLSPAGEVELLATTDVEITVTRLSLPLTGGGATGFEGTAVVNRAELGVPTIGSVGFEGISLKAEAEALESISLRLQGRLTPPKEGGAVRQLTGGVPLGVDIAVRTGLVPGGGLRAAELVGELKSGVFSIASTFRVEPPFETLALTAPVAIEWSPPPTALPGSSAGADGYRVAGGLHLSLEVEPFVIPLKDFSLEQVTLGAQGRVPRLELARGERTQALLQDVELRLDFSGTRSSLAAALTGKASFPGDAGTYPLEGKLLLDELMKAGRPAWAGADLAAELRGRGLPTALAGLFGAGASRLEALAGERVDFEGTLRRSPLKGGKGEAGVVFRAPRLEFTAQFSLADGIALTSPADFTLTVTPAAYRSLAGPGSGGGQRRYSLAEPAVVRGRVASMRLPPVEAGEVGGPPRLAFDGSMTADRWVFREEGTGRDFGFENVSVRAVTADFAKGLRADVAGRVGGSDGGLLKAEAEIGNLFGEDGKADLASLSLKAQLTAQKLPTSILDQWMSLGGLGEAALGGRLDLAGRSDLKGGRGPISLKAEATQGSLDIDGSLKEGVFTLTRPATVRLEVTEALGSKLLAKVHPFFETVHTAEEPLSLEIPREGVSIPLKGFDISRVVVPRMTLSSNRLTLRKGGALGMLIALAQQFGGMRGVGAGGDMEVWFTPVVAEIREGLFRYTNRLDLLVDRRLHAISWGAVALGPGGSRYALKIGLPAGALRKVLGTERIGDGEVFAVPLEGKEGGLDLTSTLAKATLDLGRVRGQFELSRKDPLLGIVAGELTKKIIGTETGQIPPPSISPLPWAALLEPEPPPPPPPPAGQPSRPAEPSPQDSPTPEDAIREVLPEELKGVFDILKPRKK